MNGAGAEEAPALFYVGMGIQIFFLTGPWQSRSYRFRCYIRRRMVH